jgi:hypothetical protein
MGVPSRSPGSPVSSASTPAASAVRRTVSSAPDSSARSGSGGSGILRPNVESPYHDDLRALLMTAFGPATVIADALAGVPRIDEAPIFGSWAARYAGVPGPIPRTSTC